MIDKETIMAAKAVDMNIIFHEFKWDKDRYGKIRCPNPDHNDSTPSCAFSASRNTCRCFVCMESFDTIDLYRRLSEKVCGRTVSFYKAVEEVLELEDMENGNSSGAIIANNSNQVNGYQSDGSKSSQSNILAGNGSCNSSPWKRNAGWISLYGIRQTPCRYAIINGFRIKNTVCISERVHTVSHRDMQRRRQSGAFPLM